MGDEGYSTDQRGMLRARLETMHDQLPILGQAMPQHRLLSSSLCRRLADELAVSQRQVQIEALDLQIIPERYVKNMQSVSLKEQQRLLRSSVSLIGLGGLGGWILEILARMGVGHIQAVDGDAFVESNLNRQLLCSQETLGLMKAEAAAERVRGINPSIELSTSQEFLDTDGFAEFLQGSSLAIDALGGLAVRLELKEAAQRQGLPVVTGALAGELGYVSTVYPGESGPFALWTGSSGAEESLGCPPFVVAAVASLQCTEAVHILCGRPPSLRGTMAVLDCSSLQWEMFSLAGTDNDGR